MVSKFVLIVLRVLIRAGGFRGNSVPLAAFFFGTLAPFSRFGQPDGDHPLAAFDRAAFAAFAGPKSALLRRIALATVLPAASPYLRPLDFLLNVDLA
jgi:hypothetical protein